MISDPFRGPDDTILKADERRAWKGFDWDAMNRLHEKGMIADPVNKAKSVVLTDEGLRRSEELFRALFTKQSPRAKATGIPGAQNTTAG